MATAGDLRSFVFVSVAGAFGVNIAIRLAHDGKQSFVRGKKGPGEERELDRVVLSPVINLSANI